MTETDSIVYHPDNKAAIDSVLWHQYVLTGEGRREETFTDTFRFGMEESNLLDSALVAKGMAVPDRGMSGNVRRSVLANDTNTAGLLLFAFIILSVIFSKGRYLIAYRIKDFFDSKRKYSNEYVNPNTSDARNNFALCSVLSLSLSMVAYHYLRDNFSSSLWNPYLPFVLIIGCFLCFLAWIYLKGTIYYFLNWIFFDRESNKKWMSSYFLINSLSSFAVFPISLLAIFGNIPLKYTLLSLLFVLVLAKFLLFFKVLNNFKVKNTEYLLIFLYFCAVEIVPALSVWQIFSNTDINLTVNFY